MSWWSFWASTVATWYCFTGEPPPAVVTQYQSDQHMFFTLLRRPSLSSYLPHPWNVLWNLKMRCSLCCTVQKVLQLVEKWVQHIILVILWLTPPEASSFSSTIKILFLNNFNNSMPSQSFHTGCIVISLLSLSLWFVPIKFSSSNQGLRRIGEQ